MRLNPCAIKLFKLYNQHEQISLKLIDILNFQHIYISKNYDGSNLEEYSLIENHLVTKLSGLNKVIKSYESAGSVNSSELNLLRAKANLRYNQIKDLSKVNRKLLRILLGEMASMMKSFIRKSVCYSSSTGRISPQFIDVRI